MVALRTRWKILLALAIAVVLGVSAVMAYTSYLRSSRQVISAVFDSEGNIYVLFESHMEGQRFSIQAYSKSDGFDRAAVVDIEEMPGCGHDDGVVVKGVSGGDGSITVLGQCGWDGSDFKVWEYSVADRSFSSPFEITRPGLDLAASLQENGTHGVAFTVATSGDRYCGQLALDFEGTESQIAFRDSLQTAGDQAAPCSAGIWSLAVDDGGALRFLLKERTTELSYACSVKGSDSPANCTAIGDHSWETCALNTGAEVIGCGSEVDSRYSIFSFADLDDPVADCHDIALDEIIVPISRSELAVVGTSGVKIEEC